MRNKKLILFFAAVVILVVAIISLKYINQNKPSGEAVKEISPFIGSIRIFISCTGTILPKNRLEIKPPVNGRVDRILVQEGNKVKTGEIIAWMSSTERAALLDAARGKGEEALEYWEQTYKPIPLIATIDGEVIVAITQPGQTVTTSDPVLVLSDRLIVRAQVDETDIGKIRPDMKAIISIDAYPDTKINATVGHIYYESKTVNNVTIYEVDLIPEEVPQFFRSGMNAAVDFIEQGSENALLIPVDAVHKQKDQSYVLVNKSKNSEPLKVNVALGISDDKNVEVISGITENDKIMINVKKYALPKNDVGTNPFLPSRRKK
jgi:membrane fusion protein, macrolide-specific efflux system